VSEPGRTVYLDLDGTLLDIRAKYYSLYSRIVAGLEAQPISQASYWELKRGAASPETILSGLDDAGREEYGRRWLAAIETPAFTGLDSLLPGAREALSDLRRRSSLVLATMRHDEAVLAADLARLGIQQFFSRIVTAAGRPPGDTAKGELIRRHAPVNGGGAIVVGDSEADIQAARELGVPSVCVLTGIRNLAYLEALRPDFIIDSVAQLPALVKAI